MVDVHLNWLNWFQFLILEEGQLVTLMDSMIFLSPFLYVTRISRYIYITDIYTYIYRYIYNSFFPCTAKLWNSLPIEYFPLTYDLSGFNSRINRHLLTFLCFFFLTPCLVVAVQPCLESIPPKKENAISQNLKLSKIDFLLKNMKYSLSVSYLFS